MRRVDRLLIRIKEAERLDKMQVGVTIVRQIGDKWEAGIMLWDGVDYPNGKTETITIVCDTEEEAVAAVEEVEAVHKPTGFRAKTLEPVVIVWD